MSKFSDFVLLSQIPYLFPDDFLILADFSLISRADAKLPLRFSDSLCFLDTLHSLRRSIVQISNSHVNAADIDTASTVKGDCLHNLSFSGLFIVQFIPPSRLQRHCRCITFFLILILLQRVYGA